VTVVTGHSVALNRHSHLFSTMSSLHDVLVHDKDSIALHKQPYTHLHRGTHLDFDTYGNFRTGFLKASGISQEGRS
jgi:hypothetical protein